MMLKTLSGPLLGAVHNFLIHSWSKGRGQKYNGTILDCSFKVLTLGLYMDW